MSSLGDLVNGSSTVSASAGVIRPMTSMAASRTCGAGSRWSLATTAGHGDGVADAAQRSQRDEANPGVGIVQRRDERIHRRRVLDPRERRRSRGANRGRIVRECSRQHVEGAGVVEESQLLDRRAAHRLVVVMTAGQHVIQAVGIAEIPGDLQRRLATMGRHRCRAAGRSARHVGMADRVEGSDRRLPDGGVGIAETGNERLECRRVTDARQRAGGGNGELAIIEGRDQRGRRATIANTSERHGGGLAGVEVLGPQLLDERRHDGGAVSNQGLDDMRPDRAVDQAAGSRRAAPPRREASQAPSSSLGDGPRSHEARHRESPGCRWR